MYKHILLPTDGSALSERAVGEGIRSTSADDHRNKRPAQHEKLSASEKRVHAIFKHRGGAKQPDKVV